MTKERSCCGPTCCGDDAPSAITVATPALAATPPDKGETVRAIVRERYTSAAERAAEGHQASCGCGTTCAAPDAQVWDPITVDLYEQGQLEGIPAEALLASLGCGNPTALAELQTGERVLDLGSGGGIDVLLSARRVGPSGKAYGLDMTDAMLALARQNQQRSGLTNVEFLRGEIENIPLPSKSIDVVISNCVVNLSADKPRVLREAFRVLAPGGRFAISDIVLTGDLPPQVRESVALFTGCVSGALTEDEYVAHLGAAGFGEISIEPTRVYERGDAQALLEAAGLPLDPLLDQVTGRVMSAFVRAKRPIGS
ncbi:MAG: arsenite methyltransferase [Gemmatimonadaceae bacterium]|nr:arsenite methyltransferase [Gemmatimonadaceae bacterium]